MFREIIIVIIKEIIIKIIKEIIKEINCYLEDILSYLDNVEILNKITYILRY